ncbi:MAG: hypothetical protein JNM03_00005 [Sphingopyxis sp.]|uniref:hypothetical protein n=1 Tax=Sphingopyxis sp. TaxID=1908224 RepID=UPI001A503850|nr:hypothetical protein [Sphingopyxis sp.]MBL9068357.1 hypothetical protein [Sphingopyxis sp.]
MPTEPDAFAHQQSLQAIEMYSSFRRILDDDGPDDLRFMPYNWWRLPDPIGGLWLPYTQMLSEYAAELANIINDLTHDVQRLRAWARVVQPLTDSEKLAACHEFIDTLGTVALGRPYAIKSRFAYASGHLCHQANMAKDLASWRDEFPDSRVLYLNDIDPVCRDWRKFRSFKRRVEAIGGTAVKRRSKGTPDRRRRGTPFSDNMMLVC